MNKAVVIYVLAIAMVLLIFIFTAGVWIAKGKETNLENRKQTEEQLTQDNAATEINNDAFEIIDKSRVDNFSVYVIADKKTGLCYLMFYDKESSNFTLTDYKRHDGTQFTFMSYVSYISPYDENAN